MLIQAYDVPHWSKNRYISFIKKNLVTLAQQTKTITGGGGEVQAEIHIG
ncbi:MAG: hypothetical protein F6K26_09525 [Moorea sp. SIO2I5]|nr:hypothetical protein [Moorena sp. SIO2I5]